MSMCSWRIGSWLSLFSALPGGPLRSGCSVVRVSRRVPRISPLVQLPEFEKEGQTCRPGKKKSGGCGG